MTGTSITSVRGRRVWDSRGRPTVEAEVAVSCGIVGRAIAPAGASRGSGEAMELRDGGTAFGGQGVDRAVAQVNGPIAALLERRDVADQAGLDAAMIALDGTPDKSKLGGNAMIAVSMAALHAAAGAARVPLWRHLADTIGATPRLPMPMIQIFGGGAHAAGRLDVQDFLMVPLAADSFDHALAICAEVYASAGKIMADAGKRSGVADEGGWWPNFDTNEEAIATAVRAIEKAGFRPGEDVGIALDIAATELRQGGGYRLRREGKTLSGDEMIAMLTGWLKAYPIVSIEDPLAEDDWDATWRFTAGAGQVQVIGDDLLVTNEMRVRRAVATRAVNAVLIKPNQAGTITETLAALQAARDGGLATIVSARSGESEDATIVHLATGWDAGQLKVGSFARSERMAKWNEGLRVAEALGAAAFAGRKALAPL
ncbi:MAG TPA: phosphopyruvate hydratase [Magnetospirillaceae bacterium]